MNDVPYAAGVTGLVEAMACARPVVVTRSEGLGDYLHAIDPDAIVPPGDAAAMGIALSRILATSPADRARTGDAYRAWVVANCSVHTFTAMVKTVMDGK